MKAIVIHEPGGPEVLKYEDVPDPVPGADEVLIKNLAAGINFSDTGRRGDVPYIPGTEAAGPVVAVGEGVNDFKAGDYVACQGARGGYAELVVCRTRDAAAAGGSRDAGGRVIKVPQGIKPESAVGVMLQGLTAHAMAFGAYQIKPGDKVLVQAAAGGIGLMLTQMAKIAGAYVFGTVGSDEKIAAAKEAGADHVINYSKADFEAAVNKATDGAGVNAVFDSVGGPTFLKGMGCLAPLGTMVSFGSAGGPIEPFRLSQLGSGRYVIATRMSNHTATREAWLGRASELLRWLQEGQLQTRVTTYPLARASEAHRAMGDRRSIGKLVLIP